MNSRKITISIISFIFSITVLFAQHEHHADSSAMSMDHPMDSIPMSHAYSLNLPMNRNGSGTGWLTDNTPMYGYMIHSRKWMFMAHGNFFLRFNKQGIGKGDTRGDSKVDSPNWFMFMGQRRIGRNGLFHFSSMLSLDALSGGDGYPLLFQTGEAYRGKPLVDRQHPHDLFSELSVSYTQSFTKNIDAFVYVGYPGEPAIGPVAFMHRPSTLNNPDAVLGHHWSDATHVTFGVVTIGFRYKILKLDGSLFTGREPDEHRFNFDKPRFDSYSYRLTINPLKSLSAQISHAFIKSPEALNPGEDIRRTTASLFHALKLTRENRFLTSEFVWGYNDSGDHRENSYTIESNLQLDRLAVYGRYENIQKSASELVLPQFDENQLFRINAFTLGLNYTVLRQLKTNLAVGVQGTLYGIPGTLAPIYGSDLKSFEIYMRISPTLMRMGNMRM